MRAPRGSLGEMHETRLFQRSSSGAKWAGTKELFAGFKEGTRILARRERRAQTAAPT